MHRKGGDAENGGRGEARTLALCSPTHALTPFSLSLSLSLSLSFPPHPPSSPSFQDPTGGENARPFRYAAESRYVAPSSKSPENGGNLGNGVYRRAAQPAARARGLDLGNLSGPGGSGANGGLGLKLGGRYGGLGAAAGAGAGAAAGGGPSGSSAYGGLSALRANKVGGGGGGGGVGGVGGGGGGDALDALLNRRRDNGDRKTGAGAAGGRLGGIPRGGMIRANAVNGRTDWASKYGR